MSKKDELKEEIGWFKVWLSISVAASFGMIGWFVSNYKTAEPLWLWLDIIGLLLSIVIINTTNKKAIINIKELRDLD